LVPQSEIQRVARAGAELAHAAYVELKKAVITHRLTPGQRVSEATLAADFRLSKAPVRAAMSRLAEEGLLIAAGPKTTTVAPLTWGEVQQLFHLRLLLEPDAARQAASRVNLAELERLNVECRKPFKQGNPREEYRFLMANRAFHMAIARAAGNARQARWIEQIHDAVARVLWLALKLDNRPHVWSHGHEEIIEALDDGDRAAELARLHLVDGQRVLTGVIAALGPLSHVSLSLVR
jgi:DNA-binding GntR family transcriptional regulator